MYMFGEEKYRLIPSPVPSSSSYKICFIHVQANWSGETRPSFVAAIVEELEGSSNGDRVSSM